MGAEDMALVTPVKIEVVEVVLECSAPLKQVWTPPIVPATCAIGLPSIHPEMKLRQSAQCVGHTGITCGAAQRGHHFVFTYGALSAGGS